MLVSALDEVAWLLNVRGGDVPHCPVLQAHALVHAPAADADGQPTCTLFVDGAKLPAPLVDELQAAGVELAAYDAVLAAGGARGAAQCSSEWCTPGGAPLGMV